MEPKSHQVIPRGWPLYTGSTVQRGTIEIDCQWRLDDKNVAKVLQPLKVTNDEQTLILILIGWLSFPCHITMTTFPTSLFLALFSALEVRLMVATPKEHVIIPLTAEVEYLRMLSFHQMAAPFWRGWEFHWRYQSRYKPSVGRCTRVWSLTGNPPLRCEKCCHVSLLHWICSKYETTKGWHRRHSVPLR